MKESENKLKAISRERGFKQGVVWLFLVDQYSARVGLRIRPILKITARKPIISDIVTGFHFP